MLSSTRSESAHTTSGFFPRQNNHHSFAAFLGRAADLTDLGSEGGLSADPAITVKIMMQHLTDEVQVASQVFTESLMFF